MNAYSTHLTPTITCAMQSGILWPESPILELGCGHYSTPILASIARMQNRKFKMITSDAKWATCFSYLDCEIEIIDFEKWSSISLDEQKWGMVLVDNEELPYGRFMHLCHLASHAKSVVLHDWNDFDRLEISWGPLKMLYQHIHIYDQYLPSTAIFCQETDPGLWFSKN